MNYKTIKQAGSHEIVIKKSRFICHIFRINSEEDAKEKIATIKKAHYKATHNCSAYTLGKKQEIQRFSDDGEPSGTAGIPMLEILKKLELVDCLVVVTRYFGGTKLGAGGLIRAYGGACNETIKVIGIVQNVLLQEIQLTIAYHQLNSLENFCRNNNFNLEKMDYAEKIHASIYIAYEATESLNNSLIELFNANIIIENGEKIYREVPYI